MKESKRGHSFIDGDTWNDSEGGKDETNAIIYLLYQQFLNEIIPLPTDDIYIRTAKELGKHIMSQLSL